MVIRLSGNRHRCNNHGANKSSNVLLMPSQSFFEKLDDDVSTNALHEKVSNLILYREKLLDIIQGNTAASDIEGQNELQELLYKLHATSIGIVEAIIAAESFKCHEDQQIDGKTTFLWNGENYLLKMLTDLQFMRQIPNVKDILGSDGKAFHRNPFLLPLDVSFEINDSTAKILERVPWEINIDSVKRGSRRILMEEKRSLYEDGNSIEVTRTNGVGEGVTLLTVCPPFPLNSEEIRDLLHSPQLNYDNDLVLYHVWLLICADYTYQDSIQSAQLAKTRVDSVVRTELENILLQYDMFTNGPRKVNISKSAAIVIYSMILRHLLKLELLQIKSSEPFAKIKIWLLSIVSRTFRLSSTKIDVALLQFHRDTSTVNDCSLNPLKTMDTVALKDSTNASTILHDHEAIEHEPNPSKCLNAHKRQKEMQLLKDHTSVPIWCTVSVTEGCRKLKVNGRKYHQDILPGDKIRIGHPLHSINYTVCANKDEPSGARSKDCSYICISEPFDYSPVLYELFKEKDESVELLHDPHFKTRQKTAQPEKFHPLTSLTILESSSEEAFEDTRKEFAHHASTRPSLSFAKIRIWKVVSMELDRRLQWRRDFDNGFVPWYDLPLDAVKCEHFRVELDVSNVEKDCFDSISNPYPCVHQQRLHYFERVHLDGIIIETYDTVCNWHPVSSSIDIFKWAKLARGMKFLSRVKNSNHEVDMAFLRHSNNRTLDLNRFKSVLLDMASLNFPSSRYDSREALANMLWSTVAMLPAVNTMIWKKSQQMALREEVLRVCAQTRISARFRSICKASLYCKMRLAAICIQTEIRRRIWMERRRVILLLATYDRLYRLRYLSSIICQKYWRRYTKRRQFGIYKKLRGRMLQEGRAKRRKNIQGKFRKKMRPVICRKVVSIQSVLTITWVILRDRRIVSLGLELEIQVYVPQNRRTISFILAENEIRSCFENVILHVGPLTWDKMLEPDTVSQLISRLSFQTIGKQVTVEFNSSGIVERGDLIDNRFINFESVKYVLSMYRSSTCIVIRLYDPDRDHMLRDTIETSLLCEWLLEDEEHKRTGVSSALKFWEFVQKNKKLRTSLDDHGVCDLNGLELDEMERQLDRNIPDLLKKSKESDLILWLIHNFEIRQEEEPGQRKIIFQYELEAERIECIVRNIQSIWRGKCAKNIAKEEVYSQYEKQFDRESRTFFYVHIRTGNKQWFKPAVLTAEEDVADPPDEWREAEYFDPESNTVQPYYFNPQTGQSSWLSEEAAAQIVQRKFRARQTQDLLNANLDLKQVVQAAQFTTDVEAKYEQNPKKLSHIVNFALLNHCLKFNLETAKALYRDAVSKSSSHPVIARAYGIFILATCEAPIISTFEKSCRFFKEAGAVDPSGTKFHSATENFFYWSVVMHPNNPFALLNYALLHQCVLGEYYRAEKIYRRALAQDANENVVSNYNLFIDQRYPGGYYANNSVPNVVVRRSEVKEERSEWGEWKTMIDPLCSKSSFDTFWLNSIDGASSFQEPDWEDVWRKRVERSKRLSNSNKSLWVEYYDERLKAKFVFNRTTNEYVWVVGID